MSLTHVPLSNRLLRKQSQNPSGVRIQLPVEQGVPTVETVEAEDVAPQEVAVAVVGQEVTLMKMVFLYYIIF
jgi:hypothetical protein